MSGDQEEAGVEEVEQLLCTTIQLLQRPGHLQIEKLFNINWDENNLKSVLVQSFRIIGLLKTFL